VVSGDDRDPRQQGGWLPQRQDLESWLAQLRQRADKKRDEPLHPAVRPLADLVERDAVVRVLVNQMVEQEPRGPESARHLKDVPDLLRMLSEAMQVAPEYSEDAMVMTPVAAVLDGTMATPSGFAAYRDPRVNAAIKELLDGYGRFLDGPESAYVLNDSPGGWFGEAARRAVGIDQFEHDRDAEHGGFASWNAFFTRRFKPGQRPVADPDDDRVVVAPCESTPYRIDTGIRRRDRFWVKQQPYSLVDLLAHDEVVDELEGGTIHQAYLSATNYHRWHTAVSGTVVRAFVEPGTYYSEADAEGPAAEEPQFSQSYLAHVATRAVIVVDADSPAIGRVAFVAVGMVDVSTCLVAPHIVSGAHLTKGDELGHFQFGGSTACLVFGPDVVQDVPLHALPRPGAIPVPVNSRLLTVRS
jgi:phosphatidylserine decarboxylase